MTAALLLASLVTVEILEPPRAVAGPGGWEVTGSLPAARINHTATVLADGKVLVAGGQVAGAASDGRTPSALLYDRETGTWSPTGSMSFARYRHTATLLANGKVLVAGGLSSDEGFSAELYDPATGTWTLTGPMAGPRYDHTATLLPDGKVLVAAGRVAVTTLSTAEIYDPVTGTWGLTGTMSRRRTDHAAVLLDRTPCGNLCGSVLVTGGQQEPDPTSSNTIAITGAEAFHPSTRTWTPVNSFDTARSHHTSTLLPTGKVLLSGGTSRTPAGPATASAVVFDPVTRLWSSAGELTKARWDHTATALPSGEVLLTGGTVTNGNPVASTELYNPLTASWSPAGPMAAARTNHTASLLSGNVLVAGSFSTASTELYGAAQPAVSVGDVAVHEGDVGPRAAVFTVSLSKPSSAEVTVGYATAKGTAVGADFSAKAGTLNFAPGVTSMTVKVPVAGDDLDEGDELFTVGLSSPAHATIGDGIGIGTIFDDDPAGVSGPRLTIGNVSVHEGDAGSRAAVFNVSLSEASTSYVTVAFATAKGTAGGTDFTAKSGTVTLAPGTLNGNVKVAVIPDTLGEDDETFSVKLSGASGATITDATGQGTIDDNDGGGS